MTEKSTRGDERANIVSDVLQKIMDECIDWRRFDVDLETAEAMIVGALRQVEKETREKAARHIMGVNIIQEDNSKLRSEVKRLQANLEVMKQERDRWMENSLALIKTVKRMEDAVEYRKKVNMLRKDLQARFNHPQAATRRM